MPINFPVTTNPVVPYKMLEVSFKVKKIKTSNAYKIWSSKLTPIFWSFFQVSYDIGVFPKRLSTSHVPSVPKKLSITFQSYYRPISLLLINGKVTTDFINPKFLKYLEKHRLIYKRQYEFRNLCSTTVLVTYPRHFQGVPYCRSMLFYANIRLMAFLLSFAIGYEDIFIPRAWYVLLWTATRLTKLMLASPVVCSCFNSIPNSHINLLL